MLHFQPVNSLMKSLATLNHNRGSTLQRPHSDLTSVLHDILSEQFFYIFRKSQFIKAYLLGEHDDKIIG